MDWMTISGYRLPHQLQQQPLSQQQQQDGSNIISKTDMNRSDSTIGISSDTVATPSPVPQQQLGMMGSVNGGGGGRTNSLSEPTHPRLSASSSNSSTSSSAMIDMWAAANAIKVEANASISGPIGGMGAVSPPSGISTPGSIKGRRIICGVCCVIYKESKD